MFEKLVGATVTQWADYLFAGGEMAGVKFTRSDATEMTRFFVKDHLGSIAVLTDEAGAVAERLTCRRPSARAFLRATPARNRAFRRRSRRTSRPIHRRHTRD